MGVLAYFLSVKTPGSTSENGASTARRSTLWVGSARAGTSNDQAGALVLLNGKRIIAVIPARGGSKSVPGKNVRPLKGKPLIVWSIEVAKQVPEFDRIIVSTDDSQIAEIGRAYSAEVYRRPQRLATDDALVIDALKDLLQTLRSENESAEWIVLLE